MSRSEPRWIRVLKQNEMPEETDAVLMVSHSRMLRKLEHLIDNCASEGAFRFFRLPDKSSRMGFHGRFHGDDKNLLINLATFDSTGKVKTTNDDIVWLFMHWLYTDQTGKSIVYDNGVYYPKVKNVEELHRFLEGAIPDIDVLLELEVALPKNTEGHFRVINSGGKGFLLHWVVYADNGRFDSRESASLACAFFNKDGHAIGMTSLLPYAIVDHMCYRTPRKKP